MRIFPVCCCWKLILYYLIAEIWYLTFTDHIIPFLWQITMATFPRGAKFGGAKRSQHEPLSAYNNNVLFLQSSPHLPLSSSTLDFPVFSVKSCKTLRCAMCQQLNASLFHSLTSTQMDFFNPSSNITWILKLNSSSERALQDCAGTDWNVPDIFWEYQGKSMSRNQLIWEKLYLLRALEQMETQVGKST